MKLSKTSWLILTVGISIIAFASLGLARSQQVHEQNRLNEELSVAKQRLNRFQLEPFSSQQEELEKRLSQTMSQLEAAKARWSQPTGSIGASDVLFEIGESCGVEVTEISSPGLTSDTWEGVTCSVLPLTMKVEGDVPNLINFILELSWRFPTGVVKSVGINVPEVTQEEVETGEESAEEQSGEEETVEVEVEKPSANIQLVIYTYQGD